MNKNPDVDKYIGKFSKEHQKLLKQLRTLIHKTAPDAIEITSYQMPAYKYAGRMLAYFAGHKNHVGLYPMPKAIEKFKKELKPYKTSMSTARFLLGQPLPVTLIEKILKFRMKENIELIKNTRKEKIKKQKK